MNDIIPNEFIISLVSQVAPYLVDQLKDTFTKEYLMKPFLKKIFSDEREKKVLSQIENGNSSDYIKEFKTILTQKAQENEELRNKLSEFAKNNSIKLEITDSNIVNNVNSHITTQIINFSEKKK